MSNGILPVQSTRPTLREWLLTRLFSDRGISQEFYNRLMNLCNYDYPMSPALRGYVESTFGFELVGIIEQYRDREKPVLSGGMRNTFRRIIPDEFFLEFVRIFDCDCCPPIIQEVSDISLAVDGTAIGQLTVERYIEASGDQHIHLYEWDGSAWVQLIDSSALMVDGEFTNFKLDSYPANWDISIDLGVTWTQSSPVFDPPVTSITVWFRNTVNGCVYSNLPIIPLDIFCIQYANFDNNGDPGFLFGTINGADASDSAAVQGTYTNWQGNTTTVAVYDATTLPALILLYRDSSSTPYTNFGSFQDIGLNPPVTIPIDGNSCDKNCYVGIFTVIDLATDSFTGVTFNINNFDITFDSPLIDPNTAASAYLVGLVAANMLEPTATINITLNGNEVTMTICTIRVLVSGEWSDNPVTHSGTFNFNLI